MPTCRASLRSPLTHTCGQHSYRRALVKYKAHRSASTAAALVEPSKVEEHREPGSIRTVLHKTESLLPRVLSAHDIQSVPSSLKFWKEVLGWTYVRLNDSAARNKNVARIAVYGCDEYSGARELVTALLEEPFSSDAQKKRIRDRWKAAEGQSSVTVSYGSSDSDNPTSLQVSSNWLQQFAVPVEIQELHSSSPSQQTSPQLPGLFSADIPIIVCNPVTTPLTQLIADPSLPLHHANAILAIVTTPNFPPGTWNHTMQALPKTLTTVFVDPARAISAVRSLGLDSSSSLAVQRYQDDFTGSRIPEVTSILSEKLVAASQGDMHRLSEVTAREQVQSSLDACREVLKKADAEVCQIFSEVLSLRDEIAELEARVGPEVLGAEGGGTVAAAVAESKTRVTAVVDNLTWWRCIWRVDDVGDILRAAVDRVWCRGLENELIFHSGRLASSQKDLTSETSKLLAQYISPSPFHSPVLENNLSQLQASLSYPVRSDSLTSPIYNRRAQLSYPINTLHATAQRVAIGSGGSVLAGFGIGWAGWAEHLGVLGGILGPGMEVQTAAGAGMLVTALGIRWMVARWEKARRRWWRDWDRVGQGLERDVKETLERVVKQQVMIVPTRACEGLTVLMEKRKEEIGLLKDELFVLENELGKS